MNLNHDPDKHLLDQIDTLIETHQPSGHQVLDDLATTPPTMRADFHDALQQRLLMRHAQLKQGETPMAANAAYIPIRTPRRNWLPLTLLAALIVIAIAGVVINGNRKSPTPSEMALAAASSTPTTTVTEQSTVAVVPPYDPGVRIPGVGNVSPVVVAVRDIPRGTALSSQWLSVIYTGGDTSNMYSDPEALRGLVANQDIPRWQPILSSYVTTDTLIPTSPPTATPGSTVKIVVAMQNLAYGYQFSISDRNIVGYTDWPADSVPAGAIFDTQASNITNLYGKVLQDNVPIGQPILTSMLRTPTTADSSSSPASRDIAVAIPLSALTSDSYVPGVGGAVDIVALLPFKSGTTNIVNLPATWQPDSSRIIETMLLRNTLVLFHGAWPDFNDATTTPNITFAVSNNDSRILAWLGEQSDVKFRLQKPLKNTFDIPSDSQMIHIPMDSVTADENITPADVVDIISTCAFVPDVMGANNTVISYKTDCSQATNDVRAAKATVFIGELAVTGQQPVMSYDGITLAVPRDSVSMFTKMIDAGMRFKLVKSTAASQAAAPTSAPTIAPTATLIPTVVPTLTPLPLPANLQVVDIPRDHILFADSNVSSGDSVNIATHCAFDEQSSKVDCFQQTDKLFIQGALVAFTYQIPADNNPATIEVVILSDQAAELQKMIDAGMVFTVSKSTQTSPYAEPTLTAIPIPSNHVNMEIPLDDILPFSPNMTFIEGQTYVDVIATLLTVDTEAPAKLQSIVTPEPGQRPDQVTQRVVHAALVVHAGDKFILSVTPEEAQTLQWLIDAKIPLTIRPTMPTYPTHVVTLKLDSVSHWASDNLQVGDSVDVIVGMVLGSGQNLQLGFTPYGEYNWNDPLTSGLITAQTYIQAVSTASAGAMFLRRAVQNATITAISVHKDPNSDRIVSFTVTMELSSSSAFEQSDFMQSYAATGMPYLIVKHEPPAPQTN